MDRYVKATSDLFVRYLFGSPGNEEILMDFINTILEDSEFPPAVSIEIQNPFNLKSYDSDKESILDIKAVDERGRIFDVEIQVAVDAGYIKRSLYYWARNYHSQLNEGRNYQELRPVICINILENTLFSELENAHSCFQAVEKNNPDYYLMNDFQIHFF